MPTTFLKPCIICVAITGSSPTKKHSPAAPISVSERIESTHEAFEARASTCHAHLPKADETPSSDTEKFGRLLEGLREHFPGMTVQFSTGGRSGSVRTRGEKLKLKLDVACLAFGSSNFPTRVDDNLRDLVSWLANVIKDNAVLPEIEAFDPSHVFHAVKMHRSGELCGQFYVQFVFSIKNALPADRAAFDVMKSTLVRLSPGALWRAAGIGRHHRVENEWTIASSGHTRVGLEDILRINRDTMARCNADLGKIARVTCEKDERPIATSWQAREMLGLDSPTPTHLHSKHSLDDPTRQASC